MEFLDNNTLADVLVLKLRFEDYRFFKILLLQIGIW